jgi:hypothetical protein
LKLPILKPNVHAGFHAIHPPDGYLVGYLGDKLLASIALRAVEGGGGGPAPSGE